MPRQLKNLVIDEVSSVDRGAGEGVRVMLMKRSPKPIVFGKDGLAESDGRDNVIDMTGLLRATKAADFDEAMDAIESREAAQEVLNEVYEAICAFNCCVDSIMCDAEVADKQAAINESFDQFKTHLAGLVPENMEKTMPAEINATNPEVKKLIDAAVTAAVAEAVAKAAADTAKVTFELAKAKLPPKKKEAADAMDEEEAKKFVAMTGEQQDAVLAKRAAPALPAEVVAKLAEFDEVKKSNAILVEKAEIADFEKRAVALGLEAVHGEVLRKATKGGEAASITKLEELMKGLTNQVKTGEVFKEIGSTAAQTGASAYDQIVSKAAELKKADPKLTEAIAFDKAYNDPANAPLVAQHKADQAKKIGAAA